jgi:hypothetical protein
MIVCDGDGRYSGMAFSARSMGHVQQSKTMISMARQVGGGGGGGGEDGNDSAEDDGDADDGNVSTYHDMML